MYQHLYIFFSLIQTGFQPIVEAFALELSCIVTSRLQVATRLNSVQFSQSFAAHLQYV